MKAQGYRERLIWEKPLEPGWVRLAAPAIRESSVDIAKSNLAIEEVLEELGNLFIEGCEKRGILKEVWESVCRDLRTLLKPLGIES